MNPKLAEVIAISELMSSPSTVATTTSSSSSESDSDDYFEVEAMFKKKNKHSVPHYVTEIVPTYSDEEFRRHFRVRRETAKKIIEEFAASRHFLKRSNSGGRKPLSAETQCLSFLWFAGNHESYRNVSNKFNYTFSSAYRVQTAFIEFLFDVSTRYIKMPTTDTEKEQISSDFKKLAGFDNVLGAIDSSYVYIRRPIKKNRSTNLNRHGYLSITLQGICDPNLKFLDVFVGSTGKMHDSKVYRVSNISNELPKVCGDRYHILGDGAYPLREWLLTPYRDYGDLSARQKKYNEKHAQTRVLIEKAVKVLRLRFRQLARLDFFTVLRMSKFVLGCCVLHNLCIDANDIWDTEEEEEHPPSTSRASGQERRSEEEISHIMGVNAAIENVLLHRGKVKRNKITQNL